MDKKEVRDLALQIRRNISHKKEKSHLICQKIIHHPRYIEAKIIGIYVPKIEEVDVNEVIIDAFKKGKTIAIPRVNTFDLDFYKFDPSVTLIRSRFGVLEPSPLSEKIDVGKIETIFVPAVAFDEEGNRLGFGQGYFDRALSKTKAYKIGVCFKEQMQEAIPHLSHDIKMDEIIHE